MKRIVKILTVLTVLIIYVYQMPNVMAQQKINISGIPSNVSPGQSFKITVSISGCLGGTVTISGNNCSVKPSTIMIDGSDQFTVVAGNAGSASISASSSDATLNDGTYAAVSASGSASFTIKNPSSNSSSSSSSSSSGGSSSSTGGSSSSQPKQEPKEDPRSKNNNLSSLTISEGTLSPDFSSSTTNYTVSLPAEVTEVTVSAKAEDSKAKVSGTGKQTLKAGKNTITVVCTSEYGTKKEYQIEATVDEKPLVYLQYQQRELGVVRNLDNLKVPDGFKETTVTINDKEVNAWTNETINKTIIYLINDKDEKNFYLYENGEVTSLFRPITLFNNQLYILDIFENEQKRNGMTYTEVEIDKQKMMGWTFDDQSFENYILIYVMNTQGEMQYFQYESLTQTLQPYSHAAPVTEESYNKLIKDYNATKTLKNVCLGISIVLVIGILAGGCYYYLKMKNSSIKKD